MRAKALALVLLMVTAGAAHVVGQEAALPAPGPAQVLRQAVDPASYRGRCPAHLRFTGVIKKGGWGMVAYHWVRSDGSRTATERLDFGVHEPPKEVEMTWRAGPARGEELWAAIEITEPRGSPNQAPKAVARVICTEPVTGNACAEIDEAGPIGSLVRECADYRYRQAQRELGQLVNRFRESLGDRPAQSDPEDPVEKAAARRHRHFQQAEAAWETYRRNTCEEAYYEFWPGSMAYAARLDCLAAVTTARMEYLRERLGGAENDDER